MFLNILYSPYLQSTAPALDPTTQYRGHHGQRRPQAPHASGRRTEGQPEYQSPPHGP